jgi:uncharacterized protein (TIGR02266 family)
MRNESASDETFQTSLAPVLDVEERHAADRRIEVEVSWTSESQFFAGLTGDVSTGGLFVQTYEMRPVGTRLRLDVSLPDAEIHAAGVVRWVRPAAEGAPPGLGVVFERLSSEDRESIEAFCRTRPALYHELETG